MRGMVVSDSLQHGRHLRLVTPNSGSHTTFTGIRISDVVMIAKNSSSWTLFSSKSASLGVGLLSSSYNSAGFYGYNVNMQGDVSNAKLDEVSKQTYAIQKDVTDVRNEMMNEMTDMKNDMTDMKNEMKDKLDHLSQLLERILLANP